MEEFKKELENGFPFEDPKVLLPWNKTLEEVANVSNGVWSGDRYLWKDVKYLGGLSYLLSSENGVGKNFQFREIDAYIGLTDNGWSDELVLKEYAKVSIHLIKYLGEPSKREKNPEVENVDVLIWEFDKVKIRLDIIDQFSYKCYLTIKLS